MLSLEEQHLTQGDGDTTQDGTHGGEDDAFEHNSPEHGVVDADNRSDASSDLPDLEPVDHEFSVPFIDGGGSSMILQPTEGNRGGGDADSDEDQRSPITPGKL